MFEGNRESVIKHGLSPFDQEQLGVLFYNACFNIGIDCNKEAIIFEFVMNNHPENFKVNSSYVYLDILSMNIKIATIKLFYLDLKDKKENDPFKHDPDRPIFIDFYFEKSMFILFHSNFYTHNIINIMDTININYAYYKPILNSYVDYSINNRFFLLFGSYYVTTHDILFNIGGNKNNGFTLEFKVNNDKKIEFVYLISNKNKSERLNVDWPSKQLNADTIMLYMLFKNQSDLFNEIFVEFNATYTPFTKTHMIKDIKERIQLAESILL